MLETNGIPVQYTDVEEGYYYARYEAKQSASGWFVIRVYASKFSLGAAPKLITKVIIGPFNIHKELDLVHGLHGNLIFYGPIMGPPATGFLEKKPGTRSIADNEGTP